jgi:type II secretory pathway pseudopilin PulG
MNHDATEFRRTRHGFLIADVMMGLAVLGVVAVVLISASSRTGRAADRLSNARTAGRVAEQVLVEMQAGLPLSQPDAETKIAVEPTAGGANVPGRRWVRVVVSFRGESRLLVGLVPEAAAPTAPAGGTK